jgi:hypothetical protein
LVQADTAVGNTKKPAAMRAFSYTSDAKKLSACFAVCEVVDEAVPMVVLSSTVPAFLVVHETEYAREFIEAEVASFSLPLAEFVFGEPVGQKDIPIFCGEVCFADWTSDLRVRWRLGNFQVRDRV